MVTLVNSGGNAYVCTDNPRQVNRLVQEGWQVVCEVKEAAQAVSGADTGGAGARSGEKPKDNNGAVPATKTANKAKSEKKKEG